MELEVAVKFAKEPASSPTAQVVQVVGGLLKRFNILPYVSGEAKKVVEEAKKQNDIDGTEVMDVPETVIAELKAAVERAMINMTEQTKLVYISGVELICDIPLDKGEQEFVWEILTYGVEDLDHDSDEDREFHVKIGDFLSKFSTSPALEERVSVERDSIIVYFEDGILYDECYEKDIREFADNINNMLSPSNKYICSFIIL